MLRLRCDVSPLVQRVVVEGAGHFLQETHGEFLAENVVQFLSKQ